MDRLLNHFGNNTMKHDHLTHTEKSHQTGETQISGREHKQKRFGGQRADNKTYKPITACTTSTLLDTVVLSTCTLFSVLHVAPHGTWITVVLKHSLQIKSTNNFTKTMKVIMVSYLLSHQEACHQCWSEILRLVSSLNSQALAWSIGLSFFVGVFPWYSSFLTSFICGNGFSNLN